VNDDALFRAVLGVGLVLLLLVMAYYHIRSQATGETLDRRPSRVKYNQGSKGRSRSVNNARFLTGDSFQHILEFIHFIPARKARHNGLDLTA
jgi:hypothetical protein